MLPQTESIELKKIIGAANYKLLLADKINYSATAEWDEDTSYTLGQQAKFEDITYQLIVAANTDNSSPDCSTEWREADVFETECYNTMWVDGGLRNVIAWYVYAAAAPFYTQILSVGGFIGNAGSMKEEMGIHLNSVYKEAAKLKNEFYDWYEDTDEPSRRTCMNIGDFCIGTRSIDQNKTHRKIAW